MDYFAKCECASPKDHPLTSVLKVSLKDSLVYYQLQTPGNWEALGLQSLSMNGQVYTERSSNFLRYNWSVKVLFS